MRDAVQRLSRGNAAGWVALALHISRLSPAPRPHHRRIARAVLDDTAARQGGQLFPLGNGDFTLLWQPADVGTGLAQTLARLFQVDAPDPNPLLTRWLLAEEAEPFLAYVDHCEQEAMARPAPAAPAEPAPSMAAVEELWGVVETARITDLLRRQTGVLLVPGSGARLLPLYRELMLSVALLEARAEAAGPTAADPFLLRHLAQRIDGRMLQAVADDVGGEGRMTRWARGSGPALHLNLTLSAILSPAFATFAAACQAMKARVAVEVALAEACADPETFAEARRLLGSAGLGLVLDEVSHHAFLIVAPSAMKPDLIKLEWSRQMADAGKAFETALAKVGPGRLVLDHADTEEALRWGLRQGIRRFQGRHVDAMLAASRIEACPHSAVCTLRQCIERESAASNAGRAGCRNLPLLDAASPYPRLVA